MSSGSVTLVTLPPFEYGGLMFPHLFVAFVPLAILMLFNCGFGNSRGVSP